MVVSSMRSNRIGRYLFAFRRYHLKPVLFKSIFTFWSNGVILAKGARGLEFNWSEPKHDWILHHQMVILTLRKNWIRELKRWSKQWSRILILSKEYNDYLVPFCIVIKSWKWWIFRKIMKEYSFYCPVNERLLVRHPKFKLQSDKLLWNSK